MVGEGGGMHFERKKYWGFCYILNLVTIINTPFKKELGYGKKWNAQKPWYLICSVVPMGSPIAWAVSMTSEIPGDSSIIDCSKSKDFSRLPDSLLFSLEAPGNLAQIRFPEDLDCVFCSSHWLDSLKTGAAGATAVLEDTAWTKTIWTLLPTLQPSP